MEVVFFILFILASFVNFYIPGHFLLKSLKVEVKSSLGVVDWVAGCSLFMLGCYIGAWANVPWSYLVIVVILAALYLKNFKTNISSFIKQWKNIDFVTLVILFSGTVAFTSVMFFSGWLTSNGIQFLYTNTSDGIRHLAYIKSQVYIFPPQRPDLSGVDFKGFHYFYDFMLSRFALFFRFFPRDLYFRFFPFLISFFYGASFVFASKKLRASISQERLILFLAYFGQSLSFIYWFFDKNADLTNTAVVQSIGLIINPFTVFAIPILLVGLTILPELKKNWQTALVVSLLLGVLCQTKVYAGLAGIGALVLYSLYLLVRYRLKFFKILMLANLFTAILTVITYFPNNFGAGGLIFAPFLLIKEYMQRPILNGLHWELQRQVFAQHNNYMRIILLYVEAIVFYVLINFGIRIIIILKVRQLFSISFWKNEHNFLLLSCIFILIVLGTFFIQSVSVFDTIQFYWIALSFLSIPTGLIIMEFLIGLKNKKTTLIVLTFIAALTVPGNIDFLSKYLTPNKALIIPTSQVKIYNDIKRFSLSSEILIYIPKSIDGDYEAPLVAAITGRSVYLEGGGVPNNYTEDLVRERKTRVQNLIDAFKICDQETIINITKQIGSVNLVGYGLEACPIENSVLYLDPDTHLAYIRLKR